MATIGSLRADLSANSAAFVKDMGKARAALKSNTTKMNLALGKLDRGFRSISKSVVANGKRMVSFRGVVAGLAGGAGLGLLIKRSLDAADSIAKTADKVGLGVEALQEYRFAAEQSGVNTRTFDLAIQRFSRRMGEAAQGTGEMLGVVRQYGIQMRDAQGRTRAMEDVLGDYADVIKNAESEQEQLRLAFKAFDSEGAALVNLFRKGKAGVQEYREEARRLGFVVDEKMARSAAVAKDKLAILGTVISGNVTKAILNLSPVIVRVAKELTEFVGAAGPILARFTSESLAGGDELRRRAALVTDDIKKVRAELQALAQDAPKLSSLGPDVGIVGGGSSDRTAQQMLQSRQADHKAAMLRIAERIAVLEQERQRLLDKAAAEDAADASAKKALETKRLLNEAARTRAERESFVKGILDNLDAAENKRIETKQRLIENLRFEAAQLGRTSTMQAVYNRIKAAGLKPTKALTAEVKQYVVALQREKNAQAGAAAAADKGRKILIDQARETRETSQAATDLAFTFTSAFEDSIVGAKKFSDVLRSLGQDIVRIFLRTAVTAPATKFLEGAFKSILPFALGGRPGTGSPALVGERGPEVFVPDRAGRIFPDSAAGDRALVTRMGGGGGGDNITVLQTINVETGVSQTVRAEMIRLLPALKAETVAAVQEGRRRDPRFFGSTVG
jgi:hypothetical protein